MVTTIGCHTIVKKGTEGNSENLTEEQKEVLKIWNDLSTNEQETVMSMLRGLQK